MKNTRRRSTQVASKEKAILYSSGEWLKILSCLSEKQRLDENKDNKRREMQEQIEMSKQIKDSFVDSKVSKTIYFFILKNNLTILQWNVRSIMYLILSIYFLSQQWQSQFFSQEEQKLKLQLKREKARYQKELEKIEEEKRQENLKIVEQTRLALKRNKDGWRALDSAFRLADVSLKLTKNNLNINICTYISTVYSTYKEYS